MSLEDLSPRVDPRIACAMILGIPAIAVIPLVASALVGGTQAGGVELIIGMVWCSGLGAAGLYWFYYGFSHQRGVADTPTSRMASAAQGYVELCGESFKLHGIRELFAQNGVPCLWYRASAVWSQTQPRTGRRSPSACATKPATPLFFRTTPRSRRFAATH